MGHLDPPAEEVIAVAESLAGDEGDRVLRCCHLLEALSAELGIAGRSLRAAGVFPVRSFFVANRDFVGWSKPVLEAVDSSLQIAVRRRTGRGCVRTPDLLIALLAVGNPEVDRRLEQAGTTAGFVTTLVEVIDSLETRPDPDSDQAAALIIKAFQEEEAR